VRNVARHANLPVAEKPESMELCFVPNGNYVQFIHAYSRAEGIAVNNQEGDIVTEDGSVIGRHAGIHNYTVGQRKGLGFAAGKPVYVVSIDTRNNRIIVGEDEALRTSAFEIENVNWISIAEPTAPIHGKAKIRHKHDPAPATIEALPNNRARITFETPQRAITPGQGAVFYNNETVLAGGWIK
jgi:tRNA-specific 2-thiouridylase